MLCMVFFLESKHFIQLPELHGFYTNINKCFHLKKKAKYEKKQEQDPFFMSFVHLIFLNLQPQGTF